MSGRALVPAFHHFTVIDVPGAFSVYFQGTSVGQGQLYFDDGKPCYSDDPELQRGAAELYVAWRDSKTIKRGKGVSYRLVLPSAEAAMCLDGYAEMCVHVNDFGDKEYSERAAAVKVMERCAAALEKADYVKKSKGFGDYDWVKEEA